MRTVKACNAPVQFEIIDNIKDKVTPEALASLARTKCGLKGEFSTPIGKGSKPSINIELRKCLDLYANVVHAVNIPGVPSRHSGVDIVVIRENSEGEYSGLEHMPSPDIAESLKVMTKEGTMRIAEYAFEYALLNNRGKVTAVHKSNILKRADGLFIESCQEVAKRYPQIDYEEQIVDAMAMSLVAKPSFDVVVAPNFYGGLVSNIAAGLVGSPGVIPSASVGVGGAIFEQGARHVGTDIAGKDLANPTGILLSTVMMLKYLRLPNFAQRLEAAVLSTIAEGVKTKDIGGTASLSHFTETVCNKLASTSHKAALAADKKSLGVSRSL